jgi:hypothetical protein
MRIAGGLRTLRAGRTLDQPARSGALGERMGDGGRWRGFRSGRRQGYVGRHEARRGKAAALRIALVAGVVAVAAIAVALNASGSRFAEAPTARPPPTAPQLIAAPGFGAGLGDWRAFPGTFLSKGQLGDPDAMFARVQRDFTVPAAEDPTTGSAMTGLGIRVLTGATASMRLQATVPVRGSRPGITVIVRLSERVGKRRVDASERRASLRDTSWHEVEADHRVREAGATVELEIWVLALSRDRWLDVGQAKVMAA